MSLQASLSIKLTKESSEIKKADQYNQLLKL